MSAINNLPGSIIVSNPTTTAPLAQGPQTGAAATAGSIQNPLDFVARSPFDAPARFSLALPGSDGTEPGKAADASQALAQFSAPGVEADMFAVMALFQKMAQEQRNSARQVRETEMQAQIGLMNSAAQEIRNAAQERFIGAVVQGAMQIASGAAQIAGGVAGMSTLSGAKGASDAVLGAASTKAGIQSGFGQAAGGIATGVGSIVNAAQDLKAAGHDAKKAELEAAAKVHEQGMQQANDLMQQMMDVIRDVRDKLGAMEQSRIETTRGIARNI